VTPGDIGKMIDPEERAKAAQEWIGHAEETIETVREIRDVAIVQMRMQGRSQRYVARAVGISDGRVAQIDTERGVQTERVATLGLRGNQNGSRT
jgi:hypothetical protein